MAATSTPSLGSIGRGLRRRGAQIVRALPESLAARAFPRTLGYRLGEIPAPVAAPDAPVRLLIAPANYAGQGELWARAVEASAIAGARNLEITRPGGFDFPSDFRVTEHIATLSSLWSRSQVQAMRSFTHVLIEAERPILGNICGGDVRAEAQLLRSLGLVVGFVSHGSDLRRPSLHRELDQWSPFRDPDWDLVPALERMTTANAAVLDGEEHVFVVTPELLEDAPDATWLPNIVDASVWTSREPVLERAVPRVLHLPTSPVVKGSALIDPVCHGLQADGSIEYVRPPRSAPAQMPGILAGSDVVLEQFRLGIYSTTAIEAMAAGRLVVGHVTAKVREHVRRVSGRDVPIVEADPSTLGSVLADIVARRQHYRSIAAEGPSFVRDVHDGRLAVSALAPFLGAKGEPS